MIRLKIMTPDDGVMLDEDIKYIDVVTSEGHLGLQEGIVQMVAKLKKGPTVITRAGGEKRTGLLLNAVLYVDRKQGIKILANKFVWLDEINIEDVKNRIIELERQIKKMNLKDKRLIQLEDELIMSEDIIQALK